jgi:perosamine synthetase
MDPSRRYWHPVIGYNYRMTNVAAAIGLGQIEMFDHHLGERRRIARRYLEGLRPLAETRELALPKIASGCESSYWLFSAVLRGGGAGRRDEVMRRLEAEGIETRPFFVPIHRLPMYASDMMLPEAEFLADHGLNLPTYTGLADADIDIICLSLADALRATG